MSPCEQMQFTIPEYGEPLFQAYSDLLPSLYLSAHLSHAWWSLLVWTDCFLRSLESVSEGICLGVGTGCWSLVSHLLFPPQSFGRQHPSCFLCYGRPFCQRLHLLVASIGQLNFQREQWKQSQCHHRAWHSHFFSLCLPLPLSSFNLFQPLESDLWV